MPTPYELAQMSNIVYKVFNGEPFTLPNDWYIAHKFYPENNWDFRVIIYERVIDTVINNCKDPNVHQEKQKPIFLMRVEWVIAFRGTAGNWNWVTNFGLLMGQAPLQALIDIRHIVGRSNAIFAMKSVVDDIEKIQLALGWDVKKSDLIKQDYSSSPYANMIEKQLNSGYRVKKKVMATTYTGHSLGASMAILRAMHDGVINDGLLESEVIDRQTIRAVVFDSPSLGNKITPSQEHIDWANKPNSIDYEPNVISYLSAPNVVNTLHPHFGSAIRLYVPHIGGIYSGKLHFTNRILSFYEFCARYVYPGMGIFEWLNGEGKNATIQQKIINGVAAFLFLNYVAQIPSYIFRGYFNIMWTFNQHAMDNLVECFDPVSGHPREDTRSLQNGREVDVNQWPGFYQHNLRSKVTRFLFFPTPLINRGLMDIYDDKVANSTIERINSSVVYMEPAKFPQFDFGNLNQQSEMGESEESGFNITSRNKDKRQILKGFGMHSSQ